METVQVAREHSSGLTGSFSSAYLVAGGVAALGILASTFVRRASRHDSPLLAPEPMIG
jgi:hypothetical protein